MNDECPLAFRLSSETQSQTTLSSPLLNLVHRWVMAEKTNFRFPSIPFSKYFRIATSFEITKELKVFFTIFKKNDGKSFQRWRRTVFPTIWKGKFCSLGNTRGNLAVFKEKEHVAWLLKPVGLPFPSSNKRFLASKVLSRFSKKVNNLRLLLRTKSKCWSI